MGSIQVLERTAEKTGSTVKNLCPGLNCNLHHKNVFSVRDGCNAWSALEIRAGFQ